WVDSGVANCYQFGMPTEKETAERDGDVWTDLNMRKPRIGKKGPTDGVQSKDTPERSEKGPPAREAVISLRLPVAYLRILETEAALIGIPRSHFLTLLLAKKMGQINLERSKEAPKYTFTDKELTDTKLYLWYCKPEA